MNSRWTGIALAVLTLAGAAKAEPMDLRLAARIDRVSGPGRR